MGADDLERGVQPGLPAPGDVLAGKYRIESLLARGGMGVVYAAHHELLGHRVAVKVLSAETAMQPQAQERFLHEARAAARIESDHVVRVVDVGTSEHGVPYMVLEYLDGWDLARLAAQGPIPTSTVVDYVLQALEGIAQAHAIGLVHRDLKPANLFLARRADGTSRIKVLDFGISKATGPNLAPSVLTTTSALLGSPFYMAPEQIRSARRVDARTDIWAIGVILHELLTGRVPFAGETLGELFAAILEQPPAPLRSVAPGLPGGLEKVVLRCLAPKPEERYPHVAELARALAPFASVAGTPSVARIEAIVAATPASMLPRRDSAPVAEPLESGPPGAHTTSSWGQASRSGALVTRTRLSMAAGGLVALVGVAGVAYLGRAEPDEGPSSTPAPGKVTSTSPGSTVASASIVPSASIVSATSPEPVRSTAPVTAPAMEAKPVTSASAVAVADAGAARPAHGGAAERPSRTTAPPAPPPTYNPLRDRRR